MGFEVRCRMAFVTIKGPSTVKEIRAGVVFVPCGTERCVVNPPAS